MRAKGVVRMINLLRLLGTSPVSAGWGLCLRNSISGDQESWSSVEHSVLGPRTKPQPGSEHVEVFLTQLCHAGPAFLLPSQHTELDPYWELETLRKIQSPGSLCRHQRPHLGPSAGVCVVLQRSLPLVSKQGQGGIGTMVGLSNSHLRERDACQTGVPAKVPVPVMEQEKDDTRDS